MGIRWPSLAAELQRRGVIGQASLISPRAVSLCHVYTDGRLQLVHGSRRLLERFEREREDCLYCGRHDCFIV